MAMALASRETRRRLHQEKMLLAQLAADKRQRQREEKRLLAEAVNRKRQTEHVEKKQQAEERRQSGARNSILAGKQSRCFDMTMEILNLKTVKNQQKDELLAEYKTLHLHSIPSFYQALVDEEGTPSVGASISRQRVSFCHSFLVLDGFLGILDGFTWNQLVLGMAQCVSSCVTAIDLQWTPSVGASISRHCVSFCHSFLVLDGFTWNRRVLGTV
jgi:hypothetical protein